MMFMKEEFPKTYEHKNEEQSYQLWEKSGFFNPDTLPGVRKEPFSLSMPPPNVTGSLHIGHAMFLTIEDLMTRYARMQGKRALWLPGVDHAAIATQNVVEKDVYKKEGKTRHDIGRVELIKRIDAFVQGTRSRIETQIRRLGSSCDWSRERYTLDPDLSLAMRTVFKRMYDDGLIYRGDRIVNWCPRCKSTLADDEVDYKEQKTKLYYFKYGPVVIGTARPETKFQDKIIIVHPKDKRYKELVGKELEVEWMTGKVKARVIADPIADMEFGTGAMTITPAHSFEDFLLAQKYHLPVVKIIDEDGNLTEAAGSFKGKNARDAREEIVLLLQKKGLVEKIDEDYVHNLSLCYRCGTPVEPLPSLQWFIAVDREFRIMNQDLRKRCGKDTATLKQLALWAVRSGEINIIPGRFKKIYFHWMENLHDWCISRQIWFGHQIPVWYHKNSKLKTQNSKLCNDPFVSVEDISHCPHCGGEVEQDPDTLDTWFSSALWTFSTLGWPKNTKDFKVFHPTSVMETGYDILFFWVARMIIMTLYAVGDVPFCTVYLHGLVRDREGKKMSKSAGNGIDPLDMIAKFGADPVRLSLVVGTTPGNDIRLYEEKIAGYRNFVNKLWNIGRFIITSTGERPFAPTIDPCTLADQWILSELNSIIEQTTTAMEEYRYSAAIENLYEFTWSKFADWYIEIAKFQRVHGMKESTDAILLYSLEQILKLWHPFTPFITEELWKNLTTQVLFPERGRLRGGVNQNLLLVQPWPHKAIEPYSYRAVEHFTKLQGLIASLRTFRAEHKVNPREKLSGAIAVHQSEIKKVIADHLELVGHLAKTKLEISTEMTHPSFTLSGIRVSIDLPKKEKSSRKEREARKKYVADLERRLSDPLFLSKAPPSVVEKERQRLKAFEEMNS
ncbi:MAG: valine--tRNA ligase [Patescibacteria group bacterium]